MSDFYVINNSNLLKSNSIPIIKQFQCLSDNEDQLITLQWSINDNSTRKYILHYSDLTNINNKNFIQILIIPNYSQLSNNLIKSQLNFSLFNLNFNSYYILHMNLSIIDENENQLPMTYSSIYCIHTRNFGKNSFFFLPRWFN